MAHARLQCFAPALHVLSVRTQQHALRVRSARRPACAPLGRPAVRMTATSAAPARAAAGGGGAELGQYLSRGLGVVVLKRGKARLFRDERRSLVYSGAVERVHPPAGAAAPLRAGDVVVVVDGAGAGVGYGFFNPGSLFRVRLLRHGAAADDAFDAGADIAWRIRAAFALRITLGLPGPDTDAFRAVNGGGDRLSGLVVDRYPRALVASSSAAWVERFRPAIEAGLRAAAPGLPVVWRRSADRLRQDGFVASAPNDGGDGGGGGSGGDDPPRQPAPAAPPPPPDTAAAGTIAREGGVRYSLPLHTLRAGQKTGHYTDQRDARAFLRAMVAAREAPARVLDLFAYTGGFGLNAALAGAAAVCVESSARAVALGRANAALNGVSERVEFAQADVDKFLAGLPPHETFDVVVCDPPKFAPSAKALPRALRKYRALNAAAIRRVRRGGLLLTCSCSAAVAREGAFVDVVHKAACDERRDVALLKMFGTAADHPVAPDSIDGDYLTACLFVVHG